MPADRSPRPDAPTDASRDAARLAAERFGISELHAGQREAISALAAGRDVLAVMPTGYGKSAIYQLAALLHSGLALVVSPLIALQRDQAQGLNQALGERTALAVNSTLSAHETDEVWADVASGAARYLFVSPEQLANAETVDRLAGQAICLVAVDEAHCVSSWGHDFRPDYLGLGAAIERLGRPPVAALTATAAPPVRDEIVERLGLQEPRVVVRGFDRPNLDLTVQRHTTGDAKRRALLEQVTALVDDLTDGMGLVYVARRKDAEEYAANLAGHGTRAAAYHAGMPASARDDVQGRFAAGELEVVVATSAFGMGIDQPDVRFVVHDAPPGSIDDYYQEIGRAGRDGEPAGITLHYRPEDLSLRRFFASLSLNRDDLVRCLDALRDGATSQAALRRSTGLSQRRVSAAANHLLLAGAAKRTGSALAPVGTSDPVEVVDTASAQLEARRRIEQSRVEMMRGYAETTGCRRAFLLGYFGEQYEAPCGHCDNCREGHGGQTLPTATEGELGVQRQVVHEKWGEGTVMRVEDDRITVFFPEAGYRTLARSLVETNGLLDAADGTAVPGAVSAPGPVPSAPPAG